MWIRLLSRVDGFFGDRRIIFAFWAIMSIDLGNFADKFWVGKKKKKGELRFFYFLTFPKGWVWVSCKYCPCSVWCFV